MKNLDGLEVKFGIEAANIAIQSIKYGWLLPHYSQDSISIIIADIIIDNE